MNDLIVVSQAELQDLLRDVATALEPKRVGTDVFVTQTRKRVQEFVRSLQGERENA